MSSYGHAYLTSYGWIGTGTGLRKGAIAKPLAIPPKKNLSGLGNDRDEAFPFWDQYVPLNPSWCTTQFIMVTRSLFTAASKAITIKISSDDEDADDADDTNGPHVALRRTETGIISNRRPISGTPASASTSGSATPSTGTSAALSLLATAKREAARRGLYSRFFRGPVLGPDDDPNTASGVAPPSPESSCLCSTPVYEYGEQDSVTGETRKDKKRKSKDNAESKEERRVRKRLKKECRAARAAKKAEKTLATEKAKEKKNKRRQDTSRRPSTHVDATDALNIVFTTKKKRGKREDTPP